MSEYPRRLAAIRTKATTTYAYLAQAIFAMQPVAIKDAVKIYGFPMAVDAYWRLYFDPDWLETVTPDEGMAVLIHEVSHLLRNHAERQTFINATALGVTKNGHKVSIWNLAGDAEINDDLEAEKLQLPGSCIFPEKLQPPLPRNQVAEWYYKKILETLPPSQQGGHGAPQQGDGDGEGQGGQGQQQGQQGKGQQKGKGQGGNLPDEATNCGSGAHGHQMPWEEPIPGQPKPDGTEASPGVDKVTADMHRRETARQVKEHARQQGSVPAGWKRWADEILSSKVDYYSLIRATLRASIQTATIGRSDYTYQRPARRQAAYGPIIMPSMYKPVPRICVLIDTSGSMTDTDLAQGMAECAAILRTVQCEILVISCDSAVHDVQKVFKAADIQLKGGGGTDMVVGIRKAEELKPKIDLLICITDCYTGWPSVPPKMEMVTIRVNKGDPPPWPGAKVITIEPGK